MTAMSVRLLMFDDEPNELQDIEFCLRHEWERFKWPNGDSLPPLVITPFSDKTELRKVLSRSGLDGSFDFFLCDVYVGLPPDGALKSTSSRPVPEGFQLIKMAKTHGMPLCFALSKGEYGTPESHIKARRTFESFIDGEDLLKGDLRGIADSSKAELFIAEIATRLRSKGIVATLESTLTFNDRIQESRTRAIIDEVGQATANALASAVALPGATKVSFSSLSPGLSGAKVLKLTYEGPQEDFSTRPILLKVSRDKAALSKEIANFETHLRRPGRQLAAKVAQPREIGTGPIEMNGWFAIAFECAAPAMSMVDWLTKQKRSVSDVHDLLESLFNEGGLSDTYVTTAGIASPILEGVERDLMSEYRRMAILEAIADFQPLLDKHAKGKWARLDDLKLLIEHGRLRAVESSHLGRRPAKSCLVHGDLHGRNVLVTKKSKRDVPTVIDLASMRSALWTLDLVRLYCDIFLSSWDRGPQAMEWSGLKAWLGHVGFLARKNHPRSELSEQDPNRGALSALDWLYERRFSIHGLEGDTFQCGEFSLSLAVEFARGAYRDRDMTAPKRAFALVVANTLVQEAGEYFVDR